MLKHFIYNSILCMFFLSSSTFAAKPAFLRRTVSDVKEQAIDIGTETAHYKPLFGLGDPNAHDVNAVACFGELTVDPGGSSKIVNYDNQEQIYYIIDGNGTLIYGQEKVPVKKDDFMYLPAGVEHGISNTSKESVRLLIMGYKIPEGTTVRPTEKIMLANADDVQLQILGQHGPTTQFKLLMGTTFSQRDKIAAASQANSLFLMDFAAGGTNIPHNHPVEEEIYYVLKGHGDMVAGSDSEGKEIRHPSKAGDAFYFTPGTLIGFYSGNTDEEGHAQIIAIRSNLPGRAVRGVRGMGSR
ncbi:MAG: cupin domain-containing protein [Sedimentisphaerales bacterium]|nr:cupin domain-containing protein [Sedimentisphaerales bacterium]